MELLVLQSGIIFIGVSRNNTDHTVKCHGIAGLQSGIIFIGGSRNNTAGIKTSHCSVWDIRFCILAMWGVTLACTQVIMQSTVVLVKWILQRQLIERNAGAHTAEKPFTDQLR
jgi:hypothetical protein